MLSALVALIVALYQMDAFGEDNGAKPDPVGRAVEELATATVQIRAVDGDGEEAWWGSGSLIRQDGLILTAGHLVDNRNQEYDRLEVGVAKQVYEEPGWEYRAKVAAVDYALDLAVIKIESDLSDNPVLDVNLPFVAIGNSNEVKLLDDLRILGYPATGGETITATSGKVGGFVSERRVGERAWIKTEADIGAGGSGGMAVNDAGELIAVPLIQGSGSLEASLIDCQKFLDTNEDGLSDAEDTCVPVSGFVYGLRPVNLARPLIEAAEMGTTYIPSLPQYSKDPDYAYDLGAVGLQELHFSSGATGDSEPAEVFSVLPSGLTELCGSWKYEGMVHGMRWDTIWFVDGMRSRQHSILRRTWTDGERGTSSDCIRDESGFDDGVYELIISVEGYMQVSDEVFVGGSGGLTQLSVENSSKESICSLFISPSVAYQWGEDRLTSSERIEPRSVRTFGVPGGPYDVRFVDCSDEILDETFDQDVTQSPVFVYN